jgi:glycosyltransferase involved in cell wall biosynthesis
MLAATPGLEVVVHFFSDQGLHGKVDNEFQTEVAWDVPLLDGYSYRFISNDADLSSPSSIGLDNARQYLDAGAFDAVMIHGYRHKFERQVVSAANALGIKIVMRGEFTDATPDGGRSTVKQWIRRDFLRRFYRQIDMFCYIGKEARSHLLAHGVPEIQMVHSPYSVDTQLLEQQRKHQDRRDCRSALGISENSLAIMFSGKLIPRKDPLLLIEAIRRVQDSTGIHLIMVGSGALSATVVAVARDVLGSRVTMPGFVNQSALGRYYGAADLFVLPSQFETWGLVVNEAMQFGLPVVASSRVGCRRDLIIEGKTGFTFPVGDADSLAGIIQRLGNDHLERSRMGKLAHQHIAQFSTRRSVAGIQQGLYAILGLELSAGRAAA